MTSSLGSGRTDDSTAIRTTIPGYPRSRNRSSSQWTKDSSIEAVFSEQGDESRRAERCVAQLDYYDGMNSVFKTYFPNGGPARTTVAVAGLPGESLVEINCIAAVVKKGA